jgi:hypothetical protein
MKRICWMTIGGLLISLGAAAQDNAARDQVRKEVNAQVEKMIVEARAIGPDKAMLASPVTGAPYSADETTTFTQTLADGTHIQREDKVSVYRDGQGRLRRETPTSITITDPVAGVAYMLDPNKLTASTMKVAMSRTVTVKAAAVPGAEPATIRTFTPSGNAAWRDQVFFLSGVPEANGPAANRQSLGTQTIEGVISEGTSATTTIPAGSIGNDRPIQVIDERWYSSELKTMTRTKHSDPRTGEQVFRLTNIRRVEPSPDLFQVPPGYEVIGK